MYLIDRMPGCFYNGEVLYRGVIIKLGATQKAASVLPVSPGTVKVVIAWVLGD